MNITIKIILILLFNIYLTNSSSNINIDISNLSKDNIDPNIYYLRQQGLSYLSKKLYNKAEKYYAASLQLLEGKSGEESGHLRRRCALTLAECEIKSGKLYEAIITCTEIIDESPTIDIIEKHSESFENIDLLRKTLGKAYYKRGLSLEKLNQTSLAKINYKIALEYIPIYPKIEEKLNKLESVTTNVTNDDNYSDLLADFIEYTIQNHPKNVLSKHEIKLLSNNAKPQSDTNLLSGSGLMDLFNGQTGQQGMGDLSGLLGSALPSMLGNNLPGLITNMLPNLLGNMLGLDKKSIDKLSDIVNVLMQTFQMYKSMIEKIFRNKNTIILLLTVVWVGICINITLKNKLFIINKPNIN